MKDTVCMVVTFMAWEGGSIVALKVGILSWIAIREY